MDLNNIERNQIDYILTDVLPTELSNQFSYVDFYEFLFSKSKDINEMISYLTKQKGKSNTVLFNDSKNLTTMPLKYTIMKQLHSEREISLLQPMAAIQLFLFIALYQKETLTILEKNAVFSIRFHKRNNELIYKSKNKSVIRYFSQLNVAGGKELIEQTGMFFDIGPYKSISQFTSSEEWLVLNSKYKYFIRTDYKACFDSIYTHAFNWIIGKDVNNTKEFSNGSLYTSIDRILMNINARTSNGIVVGPEFSRMVAELLLQKIDRDVFSLLLNKDIVQGQNYDIFRYVDDIFIFAETEELANDIVEMYSEAARKYLLHLNESKLYKSQVPFVLDDWLNETNFFANRASSLLFYSKEEQESYVEREQKAHNKANRADDEKTVGESIALNESNSADIDLESLADSSNDIVPFLLKGSSLSMSKRTIMNLFNELICKYSSRDKTIVAYILGTIVNKVGRNKEKVKIFKKNISEGIVFSFLDLVFYFYSFFPSFTNTQKLLEIISYVRDEFDVVENKTKLQELVNRYAFIFEKANLNDIVNLVLFCCNAKIEIPYRYEEKIVDQLRKKDDPILWASYLLYSRYNDSYFQEIRNEISVLISDRIDAIVQKESVYTYREFWWILIFNKCPFILPSEQSKIDHMINMLNAGSNNNAGGLVGKVFLDYLKNSPKQFFEWDINRDDFLRNITFKTRQRSIFKNYQESVHALYWSSL